MRSLLCPCGYEHDLAPMPDDGFVIVADKEYKRLRLHEAQRELLGKGPLKGPTARQAAVLDAKIMQVYGRLYECPYCGRLMWERGDGDGYVIYKLDRRANPK